ncbi:MAG: MgtC/SapB family protein [Firmicutes bacterium]|nr:MgtC/SapB family protein [Bacillota bacterium]
MWENFLTELTYLGQVLLAFVLGFIVGLERKMRYKEAGPRTHAIVAGGAALMLLVGKFGFEGANEGARVAGQIVTGIGFLGAGLIMFRRDSLRGVTTAAGIWATAGIGMASGAGMYVLAVGGTVFIIGVQFVLHLKIPLFRTKRYYFYKIKFIAHKDENENEKIKTLFGVSNFSRINYFNVGEEINAIAEISTNHLISDDEFRTIMFSNDFIISLERIYQSDGKD